MKRLLCIVSSMNAGGAETFLMKMYREIDRQQYQMDFCVNDPKPGFYDEEIKRLGGRIFVIPSKSSDYFGYKKSLKRIVRENGFKYILRIASNGAGFLDLKVAKGGGAQFCSVRSSNSSDGGSMKTIIAHHLGRLLYSRYIDKKIAPSVKAAKYTFGERATNEGEILVLPNAIDIDSYSFSSKGRKKIREEFDISDDCFVVGHIGRFNTQKNHKYLIEIFREFHMKNSNSKLLLVGDGELRPLIKDLVHKYNLTNDVVFAGVRKDVKDLLSSMDVLVMPSLYEGMPNVVIESQASGLSCIIADTITEEANLTGEVMYCPLATDTSTWVEKLMTIEAGNRSNNTNLLAGKGYDIKDAVNIFVKAVYDM